MRLSVAHGLQPELTKARAEAERLRQEKALLARHNRQLLLEMSRLRASVGEGTLSPLDVAAADLEAAAEAGAASGAEPGAATVDDGTRSHAGTPDVLAWPPTATEILALRRKCDELAATNRAQHQELSILRSRSAAVEAQARELEQQRCTVDAMRQEMQVRRLTVDMVAVQL